jgi:hypothetical protein
MGEKHRVALLSFCFETKAKRWQAVSDTTTSEAVASITDMLASRLLGPTISSRPLDSAAAGT